MIGNKIADKITKKSQQLIQKLIHKQNIYIYIYIYIYILPLYPDQKQKINNDLRLVSVIIMEYQKINLLDNTATTKFWTKNLVEIYDDSRGIYNTTSQITFKAFKSF